MIAYVEVLFLQWRQSVTETKDEFSVFHYYRHRSFQKPCIHLAIKFQAIPASISAEHISLAEFSALTSVLSCKQLALKARAKIVRWYTICTKFYKWRNKLFMSLSAVPVVMYDK